MSDDSLFREVDEDVRREEIEKLWKRYGNLVIAACLGVVLGVAGIKGWQYWQKQTSETAGAAYVQATKLATEGKTDEASEVYAEIAEGSHTGYGQLARMQRAGILAGKGQTQDAVKAYDALAADTSIEASLRDLAKMRAAYLLADTASVDDLKSRLAGLDVEGSAWRPSTQEIFALAQYHSGNLSEADKLLKALISDPNTPAGLRQRAQLFAAILKPQLTGSATQ